MKRTGAIVALAMFFLTSTVFSQPHSEKESREARERLRETQERLAEYRERSKERESIEKLEMLKMWKLIETLNMGEEQAQKFFILMKRQNDGERKLNKERHEIEKRLRGLLAKEQIPESELAGLVKDFIENQDKALLNRKKFYEESSKVLSVEQQAKLILFQSRFNREMLQIMKEIRGKKYRK